VKAFKAPKKTLANLDADVVAKIIAASSDFAIIVDHGGIVRDVACSQDDMIQNVEAIRGWVGHPWADVVTAESRGKVEAILGDAAAGVEPRWRHMNYRGAQGAPVLPALCCAAPIDTKGLLVAFGRDLRSVSALQQQLVDAQQSMERDYSRLRHAETRYRLIFQMSSEPLMIIDATSQKILESNPAVGRLLGPDATRLNGRVFQTVFSQESARAIQRLFDSAKAVGRPETARAKLEGGESEVLVSASLFRQDNSSMYLVHVAPPPSGGAVSALSLTETMLLKLAESAPDGFVVTDLKGQIVVANEAFLDMIQLTSRDQAISESIDRWLGRSGVDLNVLISNLRQRGSVRLFMTTLRGEHGVTSNVEVSAVVVANGEQQYFGFTIRGIGGRLKSEATAPRELPRSAEQLAELVGQVSLKELVRQATDLIEHLAIEAALRLTGGNRASAAEILGLSRQSLYVKLRRYGMASGTADTEAEAES
jgi:transcriptional regulator PpsR